MRKFFRGFKYALQGLKYAFSTQINFKFHVGAALLVFAFGWFFKLSLFEWLWLLLAIALVMIAELFNTALEVLVNLVSPDYHPLAGKVKDLASAAVLLTAVTAFTIGLFIFIPKILL